ncbi:MAG: hypothetical protein ACRCXX_14105 [Cetobacterium sp.]|uniref:hypothetical protein n=1 Tax=Cetobacterium sp. TaxID=2071632 RepID=UPI003F31D6AD
MSLSKNPIFLQSAMYVYSWFQSKIKDTETAKKYSSLEIAESDKLIVETISDEIKHKNIYDNIEARNNKMLEVLKNVDSEG